MISATVSIISELAQFVDETATWWCHRTAWSRVVLRKTTCWRSIKRYWRAFPAETLTKARAIVHSWTVAYTRISSKTVLSTSIPGRITNSTRTESGRMITNRHWQSGSALLTFERYLICITDQYSLFITLNKYGSRIFICIWALTDSIVVWETRAANLGTLQVAGNQRNA